MSLKAPQLNTRKPTGAVAAPFVLLEGEEKSGKTWAAVQLTASPKVGDCYVLDLGEGSADEYGAVPGATFEVLVHDGTFAAILEQVLAVHAVAKATAEAGGLPTVLIIDTLTDVWEGLKDYVNELAASKPSNQRKLAQDQAAELDVPRNLWNIVGNRHGRLMHALKTFSGIVIATGRGKTISATDPNTGQPFRDGRKDYRVEGHKSVPFDATLWVRMHRDANPEIVGARSVHAGIVPGQDRPRELPDRHAEDLVDWLIFTVLKYDPTKGHAREANSTRGGELTDDERPQLDEDAGDQPQNARDQGRRPQNRSQERPQHTQEPRDRPAATQEPTEAPNGPQSRAARGDHLPPDSDDWSDQPTAPAPGHASGGMTAGDLAIAMLEAPDKESIRGLWQTGRDLHLNGEDVTGILTRDELQKLRAPDGVKVTPAALAKSLGQLWDAGTGPLR